MKNFTLTIIGNDFKTTTEFMEKIILNTKATIDQEHMKMNIIINNKLLNNKENLKNILKKLENINSNLICLTFDDKETYDFIKNNINIPILNDKFNIQDDSIIKKVLDIFYDEENL